MNDLERIKQEYPEVYKAIFDEGKAAGLDEGKVEAFSAGEAAGNDKGKAEGLSQGAEAERTRIREVEAQALPGHEAIIAEMKFDGKTTGPEAAVKVLKAEQGKREAVLAQLAADSPETAKVVLPPDVEKGKKDGGSDEDGEVSAEKTREKWDADAELRAEFLGDFDSYFAYVKADSEGRVHILKTEKPGK